jgi:hypothetical protein
MHVIFLTGLEPTVLVSSILPLCYENLQILASDSGYEQKFIPISDIMSVSALFSPISDVPISGSVRYR